ncbi:HIT domain-containing protein [Blochmannia endosymbiont of Camponotus sp. C-003]|uniref:HIT domain-containing protein n=1 Tax=unclassified Candidatus Blochmanniella TaxID=711328 RepID=UPI00202435AD|nr:MULTISPECIES: HIT domain-containing protein [unclassified Candidatus Blochmannia]URJ23421.1 HIT domain-containing protein [Blochmannia endosymbiont of Camponotus sp. C-003]URJ28893.1 HIT domain-containing protein [Blochmannia endosymbiont of Camponotus sp. C-046]
MKKDNIFINIIQKKVKTDILYQDELVTAFYDLHPKAPVHVLIVPNILIPTVNQATIHDEIMLGRLFIVAAKIAEQKNIHVSGYRLIVNCNNHAGQEIYHLHMHLLGGKPLGPLLQQDNNKFN